MDPSVFELRRELQTAQRKLLEESLACAAATLQNGGKPASTNRLETAAERYAAAHNALIQFGFTPTTRAQLFTLRAVVEAREKLRVQGFSDPSWDRAVETARDASRVRLGFEARRSALRNGWEPGFESFRVIEAATLAVR